MVSLKVDNLTYRTTPEDLRRVFERCGEVGDIYIPRDRFTRESRGFAFVRYITVQMYNIILLLFIYMLCLPFFIIRFCKSDYNIIIELGTNYIVCKVELPHLLS